MKGGRIVLKKNIRGWMCRGAALTGISFVCAALAVSALAASRAAWSMKPMRVACFGIVALLAFVAAAAAGARHLAKYFRYKRYFEATGLTRCSEENVRRWSETDDVTK